MRFSPVDITCQHCGKTFHVTRRSQSLKKFCTSACYRAYEEIHGRPNPTVAIKFECKTCGKPFERMPGSLKQYRKTFGKDPMYCGIPCSNIGRKTDADAVWEVKCVICGGDIPISRRETTGHRRPAKKFCSSPCRKKFKLAEHEQRRPSDEREIQRNITRQGYVRLRFPNKHGVKGRECLEHRYVMEQHIGRELLPDETVHHVNGDRAFNEFRNLELFSTAHARGQRVVDKIAFAVEMLRLYPEFAKAAGVMLVDLEHQAA